MTTIIMKTTARVVVPIVLVVAISLFLQGHSLPGGGFIGGVLTVAGFALVYVAYDRVLAVVDRGYRLSSAVHPTALYRGLLAGIERSSGGVHRWLHTGLIRSYVWWALAGTCAITLAGYAATDATPAIAGLGVPTAMVLVLGVAVVAA